LDFALVNSAQLNRVRYKPIEEIQIDYHTRLKFYRYREKSYSGNYKQYRKAVHQGLNYLGICAGGFLAGNTRKIVSILPRCTI